MRPTWIPAAILSIACAAPHPCLAQTLSERIEVSSLDDYIDLSWFKPAYEACFRAAGKTDQLFMISAYNELLSAEVATLSRLFGAGMFAGSDPAYRRLLKPEFDDIGPAYVGHIDTAQDLLRGADCADIDEAMQSATQEMLRGYALLRSATDAFETARTLPPIQPEGSLSHDDAVVRSAGRVLLRTGDGYGQIYLRNLVDQLAGSGLTVEVHGGDAANAVQAYFYGNYFPDRPFAEREWPFVVEILTTVARSNDLIPPAP